MNTLDAYKKYLKEVGGETLTEEEIVERFNRDKQKFDSEVNNIAGSYKKLDMDEFIQRIGGKEKIDEMKRINDAADRLRVVDGKVVEKEQQTGHSDEKWKEEWKKGFMEGFEEAFKRLNTKG